MDPSPKIPVTRSLNPSASMAHECDMDRGQEASDFQGDPEMTLLPWACKLPPTAIPAFDLKTGDLGGAEYHGYWEL